MIGYDNICIVNQTKDLRPCSDGIKYSAKLEDPPVVSSSPKRFSTDFTAHARICLGCGNGFRTNNGRVLHCSPTCRTAVKRTDCAERQAAHRKRHPERDQCRSILRNAILLQRVRRPSRCETCGVVGKAEAHHEDYSRPFYVTWLCRSCHASLDDGQHFGCGKTKHAATVAPSSADHLCQSVSGKQVAR